MKLTRGLNNWQRPTNGCVATIGNFDGVHRGHRAIFTELKRLAEQRQCPSTVVTFEPLPHEFFASNTPSRRISSFRDKVDLISACGIENLVVLRFNPSLAEQQPEQFVQQTLLERLGVKHLLIGDDFRFGKNRAGNIDTLRQHESDGIFGVSETPTIFEHNERISSTRIREALTDGNCEVAGLLLGEPYRITGRVNYGAQLGRTIGFPTANVALKQLNPLLRGVFAVDAIIRDANKEAIEGHHYPAIANLGERPTVDGKQLLLEVHLLDQQLDLYGNLLQVNFRQHIRNEKKFNSLDELKAAIAADAKTARSFFKL